MKILQLVNSYNSTYKLASRKRMELVDLIKERVSLLDQLGIRYLYDPFDRIGLNDQLEIIKAFGNNYDNIKSIRKGIDELSKLNDEIIAENRNYADYFKVNIELFGFIDLRMPVCFICPQHFYLVFCIDFLSRHPLQCHHALSINTSTDPFSPDAYSFNTFSFTICESSWNASPFNASRIAFVILSISGFFVGFNFP